MVSTHLKNISRIVTPVQAQQVAQPCATRSEHMVQRNWQLVCYPHEKDLWNGHASQGGCRSLPSATFQAQDTISQSLTSTSSSVMTITLGRASVKNQKHVTRLAPKTNQEKWLQKVMLGLCSKLTGWGVLKPHSQLTQAAIHHARCPKLQSAKG